jgi:hypothetical protein
MAQTLSCAGSRHRARGNWRLQIIDAVGQPTEAVEETL